MTRLGNTPVDDAVVYRFASNACAVERWLEEA
jgi:hypothetical protein